MKLIHSGAFHSILCSIMFRRENIWYVHPFPLRNLACSWRSLTSISPSIICYYLSWCWYKCYFSPVITFWRSPFFGRFTIIPLFQSLGITSFVHISLKCVSSISLQMLSVTGAFPDFICCIACVTSCSVGTSVAISRSSFGGVGGGGDSSYGNYIQNFWKVLGPFLNCGFDGMESSLL